MTGSFTPASLTIGQYASLSCLMEVTAAKPGNVHRGADFEDATFFDFAASAVAIAPAMEQASNAGIGATVLAAVEATRRVTRTNTNLGTILLLAPLAAVPRERPLADVAVVLAAMNSRDAELVYEAIRLAQPGGLGRVNEHDVAEDPPADLLAAMRAAANRDLVARQYVENFDLVLGGILPWLRDALNDGIILSEAIVYVYLKQLSEHPDSLIARKCGQSVAQQAADRAAAVLESGRPGSEAFYTACADFDFWLRSDHHRRNPGTTADLMAAGLFAALHEGAIELPLGWSSVYDSRKEITG